MEIGVTLLACGASAVVRLTKFTDRIVSQGRCANTLDHIEPDRITELRLGVPKSAVDMDPVVVSRTLKRLSRHYRPTLLLLFQAIFISGLFDEFLFHTFFLSFSVRLLLV